MLSPASEFLFPAPRFIKTQIETFTPPTRWEVKGETLPVWLQAKLEQATALFAGQSQHTSDAATLTIRRGAVDVSSLVQPAIADQAYRLTIHPDGNATLESSGSEGFQHGIVTLCQLFTAAADGAMLTAMTITDAPMFTVRGVQVDIARDFFPPLDYLMKMVDRCVELKFNALWLYLENRFAVPGLEDMAGHHPVTPDDARKLSAYAKERGVDVVPATNVLCHMEGWFKLERYSHLADGPIRSYAIATKPELWELVTQFLDAMIDAFPSDNIQLGLDELLRTGTNPEAVQAMEAAGGKPHYYADYVEKIVRWVQGKGKRVWIWDDMIVGINVYRKTGAAMGFGDAHREALSRLPKDVVLTHWYYEANEDGSHTQTIQRVAAAGRPLAIAPGTESVGRDYPAAKGCAQVLDYMAGCAKDHGAFALIQTHWQATWGLPHESHWPLTALASPFAWNGPTPDDEDLRRRLAFAMTRRVGGALAEFFALLDRLEQVLADAEVDLRGKLRKVLIRRGPYGLWENLSPLVPPAMRQTLRDTLREAEAVGGRLQGDDEVLLDAIRLSLTIYETALDVIDTFDMAWQRYHQAACCQPDASQQLAFEQHINAAAEHVEEAGPAILRFETKLQGLESIGHTPYDACLLKCWRERLNETSQLIRDVAASGMAMPTFQRLMMPQDAGHLPNLSQLTYQLSGRSHDASYPWPIRWAEQLELSR